jgi:hypothetical protein
MKTTLEMIQVIADSEMNRENFDKVVIADYDEMTKMQAISFLAKVEPSMKWQFSTNVCAYCLNIW